MGITEIIVVLVIALIVIPPDKLPEVMRTVGKVLRELRLASNTVVRELTEITDDPLQLKRPPAAIAKPSVVEPPAPAVTSVSSEAAIGEPPVAELPAEASSSVLPEAAPVGPLKP